MVWRWLSQLDTRTPPVIISPSSGPDKDLDITDGVESVQASQSALSCHVKSSPPPVSVP